MTIWAIPPLLAFCVNLALALYIIVKFRRSPVDFAFSLLCFTFALWTLGEFMLRLSAESLSRLWVVVQYAGIVIIPITFFHFAVVFGNLRRYSRWRLAEWIVAAVSSVFLLSLGTNLLVKGTKPFLDSYGAVFGPAYDMFSVFFTLTLALGLGILAWRFRTSVSKNEKRKSMFILIAAGISAIGGTITDIVLISYLHGYYPLASTLTVGTTLIMAYGITRYKLFFIEPAAEVSTEGSTPLEKGYVYIVPEEKPEKCYELFAETVKSGVYGLCLTTGDPVGIRKRYGLEKTPIVRLSKNGTGKTELDPVEALSESAYNNIREFISQANDSVILVDDSGPIVLGNFSRLGDRLNTLDEVNRFATLIIESESRLIVSVKPSHLTPAGNSVIKTKSPIRFSPALNAAVFEKVCNDEFRKTDASLRPKMITVMLRDLKVTSELSAGLKYENGAVKFDFDSDFSSDKLFALLRGFASAFRNAPPGDGDRRIIDTLEKYGYNKYEYFLTAGSSYIISESTPENSNKIFRKYIEEGYAGLNITRAHRENNNPDGIPINARVKTYWLTDLKEGSGIIQPKPEYVKREIEKFLEENKGTKSIILLDGLEYLITHGRDSFESMLTMMNMVSDILVGRNAILIAPFDPGTMAPERFSLLSRTMKQFIPPKSGVQWGILKVKDDKV